MDCHEGMGRRYSNSTFRMKPIQPLHGLVAAPHTPFHADGSLNLDVVEQQAAHLLKGGVGSVFIGGSTGEGSSLSLEERRLLARRWSEVVRGTKLRLVVHVGTNCLADARVLAVQAEELGATAIGALAPSYFKPRSLDALIACCAEIASAAPETPFYYYDIPVLTGVSLSTPDFLAQAKDRIPTLAGLKFTNPDLMAYQFCIRADGGRWDVPFGVDEHMLGALAMGAQGAVGSGFNFAAPVYQRLLAAFSRGDLAAAREEQFRAVRLIQLFAGLGYMGAAKAAMGMLGVNVGPARLPNQNLTPEQTSSLRGQLEGMGFFDWVR
jgi:N-acetylneuraminate lyase